MIFGIGADLVQISRMNKWADNPALIERYFAVKEIDELKKRGAAIADSLAAHFAAKEAFGKALGGFAGIALRDIMVLKNAEGKPFLHLEGSALEAMKTAGVSKAFISLTHEGGMALAMVVLEN